MESKDLQAGDNTKYLDLIEKLEPKQLAFLTYLRAGLDTIAAYHKAGYVGNDHAAYQLKSRLNKEYETFMRETAMSAGDWLAKLNQVLGREIIRVGAGGHITPVEGVTMDQYLKALGMQQKFLETEKAKEKKSFTAFQINTAAKSTEITVTDPEGNSVRIQEP